MSVQFVPPPTALLPSVTQAINAAVAALPPGKAGAIVGIATELGVNAAIVAKVGESWRVTGWVGKSWGHSVSGGASVMVTW